MNAGVWGYSFLRYIGKANIHSLYLPISPTCQLVLLMLKLKLLGGNINQHGATAPCAPAKSLVFTVKKKKW